MSICYVGLDLGSSKFQQVAINERGASTHQREFTTSETNLVKAFSGMREARFTCIWKRESWRPGPARSSGR